MASLAKIAGKPVPVPKITRADIEAHQQTIAAADKGNKPVSCIVGDDLKHSLMKFIFQCITNLRRYLNTSQVFEL